MATAYSGGVTVGNNKVRLKVDYSGTSASCTVQFCRTSSSYTGTFSDTSSTLTFNGTTKAAPYSYTGTVTTSTWVDLVTVSGYTVSAAGGTYNWSFYNSSGGVLGSSGTITISAQHSLPTGLTATITSHTPTSITATASVTSWNNTGASLQFLAAKTTNWTDSTPRQAWEVATTATSGSKTGTNSNTIYKYDSSFPIKGCMTYYLGAWAKNSDGDVAKYWDNTARYIQPATPTTCAVASQVASETSGSVAVTLNLTGAGSSNNYEATVTFYVCYRYSTDGGSTWTNKPDGYWPARSWSSAGTGKPWDTKTFTFSVPYGAKVEVKFLQQFQSRNSTAKDLSFTAMSATSPSGLSISGAAGADFYPVVTGSITSYGRPNSVSNRAIALGVTTDSGGTHTIKRERAFYAQTSGTATLNNSDVYPGENPLTLKGCQRLYPYIWAHNRVASSVETFGTSFYTRPATPASVTYAEGSLLTLTATDGADNESVSASYTFKIEDSNGNVVYTGGVAGTTGAGSSGSVSIQPITAPGVYTIYAKIVYNGLSSGWASTTYTVVPTPKLYGPVQSSSKQVVKLYGPAPATGDQTTVYKSKQLTKFYGSVSNSGKAIYAAN